MKNKYTNPELKVYIYGIESVETGEIAAISANPQYTAAQDVTNQFQQIMMRNGGGTVTTVKIQSIMGFK